MPRHRGRWSESRKRVLGSPCQRRRRRTVPPAGPWTMSMAKVEAAAAYVGRDQKGPWPLLRKRWHPSRRLADIGRTVPVPAPVPAVPRHGHFRRQIGRLASWGTVRRWTFAVSVQNKCPG